MTEMSESMLGIELLNKVKNILNEGRQQDIESGKLFNIFELLDVNTKEVKMCKLIAELINPNGTCPNSKILLKTFIKMVLQEELEEIEFVDAKVHTEYKTDTNRRIDIVIETKKRFIPIEAKIYAGDQNAQCSDYYWYSLNKGKKNPSNVYYLTLDGSWPSEESCIGLTLYEDGYKEVTPISFDKSILGWISYCLEIDDVKRDIVSYVVLKQLKDALERLCNTMCGKSNSEISKFIKSDKEIMKAAFSLTDIVLEERIQLIIRMFEEFIKRISDEGVNAELLDNKFDYRSKDYDKVKRYYHVKTSTNPGISYKLGKTINGLDIWFRIELGHYLYCGLVTSRNGDWIQCDLTEKEIKETTGIDAKTDGWWLFWEYLPIDDDNKESTPNFKQANELYYELFDEDRFDSFISKCMIRIVEIFKKLS